MILASSCCCLWPIHWSQVLSREWRCSWSSADRRCSNYIGVVNNFITYWGATYIRGLTVVGMVVSYGLVSVRVNEWVGSGGWWVGREDIHGEVEGGGERETQCCCLEKTNPPITKKTSSYRPLCNQVQAFHGYNAIYMLHTIAYMYHMVLFLTGLLGLIKHCDCEDTFCQMTSNIHCSKILADVPYRLLSIWRWALCMLIRKEHKDSNCTTNFNIYLHKDLPYVLGWILCGNKLLDSLSENQGWYLVSGV